MLKIGEFSSLSRISIRMLRYYDENSLLKPAYIDKFTGYRYYQESQLALAGRINALRDMGFGVTAMSGILNGDVEVLEQALILRRSELEEQKRMVYEQLSRLESALRQIGKDENTVKYEVSCKTLPELYVASVRGILPSYYEEGRLWHTMMKETSHMDMQMDDPRYAMGVYHDGEHRERDVDVEIQLSVKGHYEDTEHVKFKAVPPVFMASAVYTGSYEQVGEVNAAVATWVRDNGYEFNGLPFCIYHVSPDDTRNPDELVTEVCFPIRKKEVNQLNYF